MNAQLGIWIDRKQAIIVSVNREHSLVTRLRSSLRPHGRYHAKNGIGESKYEARDEQEMHHYLDAVMRHVERGDEVLLLGPGDTKRTLARRMKRKRSLSGVTTRTVAADALSEAQVVAAIRKRYSLPL